MRKEKMIWKQELYALFNGQFVKIQHVTGTTNPEILMIGVIVEGEEIDVDFFQDYNGDRLFNYHYKIVRIKCMYQLNVFGERPVFQQYCVLEVQFNK